MLNYSKFSWLRIADFPQNLQAGLRTDDYQDYLINARPDENYDIKNYQVTSPSITRHLDEGDVVDLGNNALTDYHLPGHSPGSIGLWGPSGSTLFSGDALYNGQLLDQLPGSNIPDYIDTMKRLRELPVEAVHGGHEPSFGRKRMIALVDAYLDWRAS